MPASATPSPATSAAASVSVEVVTDRTVWDHEVNGLGGHPLQLWGWGEVKSAGAWTAHRLRITAGGHTAGLAQVLERPLPAQFKALTYVPRGPVVAHLDGANTMRAVFGVGDSDTRNLVTNAVTDWARENVGGVGITLEPDWPVGTRADLPNRRYAPNPVLYPSTLILDLRKSEDELMSAMSKKTRQYIRKSLREDLEFREVTTSKEIDACLRIYRQTAERAGFGLHSDSYYHLVKTELGSASPVFAAFARSSADGPYDRPVSFVWFAASNTTSFELYGGMNDDGMNLRANYGLKWHAICAMKDRGVIRYDVNGLLNDGISNFKRGFAKHEDELVGSIDVPFSRWYSTWNSALPTAKKVVRKLRGSH
ncbi:lipid II:glycine glycyltransferase FemX [Myceligenerans salitolerans]|uniref:Peptidoglycan bridge formation glycyltransferase FemA/FemB family protein n=1 Tax=Myceligenerans salitolerans TaxID=1230528 RepID=A0ABS3IC79_9MICO|nr:peptidoglycan bridge formation glycyltransferase FemA/FemB family protein [Myceligenerans salitolerans]MBO0610639.1 peptidoglycan bridge formation glycyltransferase FemA/FemB family protein [Myceligenerans salitolerans]